ncbi:MAG: aldo/keto reductase [Sphingomonadales bacterium]|nr:aldo/keto reductase [Sphingomonadales bacterium]
MEMRKLGSTGIDIAPLVLGGNVFGWTADQATSFAILDAALDAGINAIDTADVYNRFAPGGQGGESETVIGAWMKDRGVRDRVVIITKGGLPMGDNMQGLGRDYLTRACEASLRRLQTDRIDVYMSHRADPTTPIAETLETFQALIDAGKVGHAAASNYTAGELAEALAAAGNGRARYAVLEPHYNLVKRDEYEGAVEALCQRENIGVIPFFALAAGFLTGKYRSKADLAGKAREMTAAGFMTERNLALLGVLDRIAARHDATPAQVSLAWLMARPSVTAPIVSATSLAQLGDIVKSVELKLTAEDLAELNG